MMTTAVNDRIYPPRSTALAAHTTAARCLIRFRPRSRGDFTLTLSVCHVEQR